MKKIHKKLLVIGLTVLFFSVSLIYLVRAQDDPGQYFRVDSASSTPTDAKRAGDEALVHVINRSSRSYFLPNKTFDEFESFRNHAPNYVSVAICGDGVCSEGETIVNCPDDCGSVFKEIEFCGNGFCDRLNVCTTTPVTFTSEQKTGICNKTSFWNWLYTKVVKPATDYATMLVNAEQMPDFCASQSFTINMKVCEYSGSETWETCPDDCAQSVTSGCGVCGYDGAGNLCPNLE